MHLIKDENGNLVGHAHGHTHEHGCHEGHSDGCGHSHDGCGDCQEGGCRNETIALLDYMLKHNEHHAAELDQIAADLRKLGIEDAAKQIEAGVADFQKGNMRLSLALTIVKEELKEA